jgi:tetratricopeptide (TPR) repeat protein
MKTLLIKLLAIITFCVGASFAMADEASDLHGLQTRWAEIKYNTAVAEKEKAFLALIGDAEKLSAAHQSAPFLIWEGIIRSTYAGVKGGLGALDQVKHAKKLFEQSIALQPDALNGAAYTSLGSLYYQVPGWPVGFGDDKKANEMLLKGLSYNPDGIDSNYFYGDYLLDQKQYKKAVVALEKALKAPARPGRESADAGRRAEASAALAKAQKH